MRIELNEQTPIYRQLIHYFEQRILDKTFAPDEALPSVRTIAVELTVNPQTILKSFQELLQRNIIYKKRGSGMYVTPEAREILLNEYKESYLRQDLTDCLKRGLAMDMTPKELLQRVQNILQVEEP